MLFRSLPQFTTRAPGASQQTRHPLSTIAVGSRSLIWAVVDPTYHDNAPYAGRVVQLVRSSTGAESWLLQPALPDDSKVVQLDGAADGTMIAMTDAGDCWQRVHSTADWLKMQVPAGLNLASVRVGSANNIVFQSNNEQGWEDTHTLYRYLGPGSFLELGVPGCMRDGYDVGADGTLAASISSGQSLPRVANHLFKTVVLGLGMDSFDTALSTITQPGDFFGLPIVRNATSIWSAKGKNLNEYVGNGTVLSHTITHVHATPDNAWAYDVWEHPLNRILGFVATEDAVMLLLKQRSWDKLTDSTLAYYKKVGITTSDDYYQKVPQTVAMINVRDWSEEGTPNQAPTLYIP